MLPLSSRGGGGIFERVRFPGMGIVRILLARRSTFVRPALATAHHDRLLLVCHSGDRLLTPVVAIS